jgi:hypothetical protein
MKIRLRREFFAVNLSSRFIDRRRFFRNFTGTLARNAECFANVSLSKLSYVMECI